MKEELEKWKMDKEKERQANINVMNQTDERL